MIRPPVRLGNGGNHPHLDPLPSRERKGEVPSPPSRERVRVRGRTGSYPLEPIPRLVPVSADHVAAFVDDERVREQV